MNIQEQIDTWHEQHQEAPRAHLGASLLGHPCDRYLWLQLRWAVVEKFPGRLLRLFRRGQLEEDTIIADLNRIGLKVQTRQTKVDFGSHISGSADGVLQTSKTPTVLECKTHSLKSFKELAKKGVKESKLQHWVQMQVYMHGLGCPEALYYAVCKDNDEIYTEIVAYERQEAEKYIERGKKIALSDYMPEPMSADESYYLCRWCPAHEFCFKTKCTKEVNCRTCAHVTPTQDSQWLCARHDNEPVPVSWQRAGCESHVLHPDLVPYPRQPSDNPHEAVYVINGVPVRNGEPCGYVFGSKEILADPELCANPDVEVILIRDEFNARIVEPTL